MKPRLILSFFLLLLAALLVPVAAAQSGVSIEFDAVDSDQSPQVQDADFPRLTVTFTPLSDSGVPIAGLTREDFTVLANGAPVENFTVTERADPNQGISVLLVLDASGSMRDDIDALRAAAATLFDEVLEQSDQSAIITFAALEDGTTVNLSDPFPQLTAGREVNFTNDEGMLKNLVNALIINQGDGTPLYDAIYKGTRMARSEAANTRRLVIVMTDGVDESREGVADQGSLVYDRNGLIEEIRGLNVPVFTVGLGDEIDSAFLQRVANTTGGTYQNAPTAAALAGIFTEVASQLKVKYDLSFESTQISDGALHNLEIQAHTPDGTATATTSFQANYPIEPWVQDVQAANPRQDLRPLSAFASVKGNVTLQPTIVARGDIAAVNYYVNDELVYTAEASPWSYVWDTTKLTPGETHRLTIEAQDTATPANVGRANFDLPVEACSIICLVEEGTGIPIGRVPVLYWLLGLAVLLILFALFLLSRRRRPEPAPAYVPAIYPPIDLPLVVAPQPPTLNPALSPETVAPPGRRRHAKTEVIDRAPGPIAFLIDAETGRSFPLRDATSIGSDTGNDIVLDEPSVSGQHAKIRLEDGTFAIFDLGSTNRTEVNGDAVTRHVLANGDRVQLGRKTLMFKQV